MTRSGGAPSMLDVATRAGVSAQTVSRVLNGSPLVRPETRARVLVAVEEMGYRRNPGARFLATNRSRRLGVIAAHLALHGPSRIVSAVDEAAHRVGYDVSLVGLDEVGPTELRGAVDRLLDQSVEALLVAVAHQPAMEEIRSMSLPIPLVMVQGVEEGAAMSAGIDQRAGARAAVGHLLDLGHRSVAHVAGPSDWVEALQRQQGWEAEHRDRGLVPGPVVEGDWSAAGGHAAAGSLLDAGGVTAVFAANDATAIGVLKAAHDRQIPVPDRLSVIGFDDMPDAAYLWPALTTVRQTFGYLGGSAVDLALRALAEEVNPTIPLLVPDLVVRDSTGSPA